MSKSKATIGLLILNLIVMIYFGNSLGNKLDRIQSHTTNELNRMQNLVLESENRVVDRVGRELQAQADKVTQFDYDWSEVDVDQQQATIVVTAALSEVSPEGEIFIVYRAQDGSDEAQQLMSAQDGLVYETALTLSLEHDYEFDIMEQSAANGLRTLSTTSKWLPVHTDFYDRRVQMRSSGTAISTEEMRADFSFTIDDLGMTGTEMEQVHVRIMKDSEQIDEIDVTALLEQRSQDVAQLQDHYNLALASGQIDESVSLQQFMRDSGLDLEAEEDGTWLYSYTHVIRFADDYPELSLNQTTAEQLNVMLIVKFADGYVFNG